MILIITRGKPDLRSGLKLGEAEEILSVTWGAAFSSPRQYINKLNSTQQVKKRTFPYFFIQHKIFCQSEARHCILLCWTTIILNSVICLIITKLTYRWVLNHLHFVGNSPIYRIQLSDLTFPRLPGTKVRQTGFYSDSDSSLSNRK